jgi:Clostripain family
MDRKWTVIVYMVADTGDSFYQSAMDNVFQMTNAKFNEERTKVLVHADAPSPWVSTCWNVMTGTATPLRQGCDHTCFLDFAKKCVEEYDAENYLIVLWGHGEGIDWKQKVLADSPLGKNIIGAGKRLWQGSKGALEVAEIGQTLKELHRELEKLGLSRDRVVVGFDACLMGMVEVYYEIWKYVGWGVAAADEIPDTGWSYTDILRVLGDRPETEPKELADKIVDSCTKWYSVHSPDAKVTFAACDLSNSDSVLGAMTNLTSQLCACIEDNSVRAAIKDARAFAEDLQEKAYIDLWAFCSELRRKTNQGGAKRQELHSAASRVIDALRNFVSRHKFSDAYPWKFREDARGLSICFPESADLVGSIPNLQVNWGAYRDLAFSLTTHWPDFLMKFWGRQPVAEDAGTVPLPARPLVDGDPSRPKAMWARNRG